MMRLLLGVLLGLGLGLTMGWVWFDDLADEAIIEERLGRSRDLSADRATMQRQNDALSRSEWREERPAAVHELSHRNRIGSSLPPMVVKGDATLRGRVITLFGKPVEGVEVWALPEHPYSEVFGEDGFQLTSSRIRNPDAAARWFLESARIARTDAQGNFQLDGVLQGPQRLGVLSDRYQAMNGTGEGRALWTESGAWLSVRVSEEGGVLLDPKDETGQPIDRLELVAWSRLDSVDRTFYRTWTRACGPLELPVGAWMLSLADGERSYDEEQQVSVSSVRKPERTIPWIIRRARGVRGHVLLDEDYTGSVVVYAVKAEDGTPSTDSFYASDHNYYTSRDEGFRYALPSLDPGAWHLGVGHYHSSKVELIETVQVGSSVLDIDLLAPALADTPSFQLLIRGPDGHRLADDLVLSAEAQGIDPEGDQEPLSEDDLAILYSRNETLHVVHPFAMERKELTVKNSLLFVRHALYGELRATLPPPGGRLELTFVQPVGVQVSVSGLPEWTGQESVGVDVYSGHEFEHPRYLTSQPVDPHLGTARIDHLAPGAYAMRLSYAGPPTDAWGSVLSWQGPVVPVVVRSAAETIEIAFPTTHTLTVTNLQARFGGTVYLHCENDEQVADLRTVQSVGEGGTAHFDGLLAGTYWIEVSPSKAGDEMIEVAVRGAATVAWEERAINALGVTIWDPESWMAGTGLRQGDVLLAVDGVALNAKNIKLFEVKLWAQRSTLSVLRDGKRLKIPFDPIPHMTDPEAASNPGGRFFPCSR